MLAPENATWQSLVDGSHLAWFLAMQAGGGTRDQVYPPGFQHDLLRSRPL